METNKTISQCSEYGYSRLNEIGRRRRRKGGGGGEGEEEKKKKNKKSKRVFMQNLGILKALTGHVYVYVWI